MTMGSNAFTGPLAENVLEATAWPLASATIRTAIVTFTVCFFASNAKSRISSRRS